MNYDERIAIETHREYRVVKSNELVQQSRFELSLTEQKTVAFICSMIKPIKDVDKAKGVPFQLEYEFNIRDYCKICGIDYAGGKNYRDIKATLKHLADRSMWLDDGESETLMRWLSYVKVNKKSEKVLIEIDRTIAPFLFGLKDKFAEYQLYNILAMKSAFSVRIYELMKSYAFRYTITFDLDELKRLLMVEDVKSYARFPDFRRKVLEVAQREINELTDINIHFEPITKGRKVVKLKFRIESKSSMDKSIAEAISHDRLGELD